MADESILHRECREMALVLEGLAGTLHEGLEVDRTDLRDAAQSAEWVWQAGPKPAPARAREFEAAHAAFMRASERAAWGQAREGSLVERAARHMAAELREMARDSQDRAARKELPAAVDEGIGRMMRRYATRASRAA